MNENSRKVALVVGAIAAAAGVAVASYMFFANDRRTAQTAAVTRTVSEVLSDCYTRIQAIQDHLAELHPSALYPKAS